MQILQSMNSFYFIALCKLPEDGDMPKHVGAM